MSVIEPKNRGRVSDMPPSMGYSVLKAFSGEDAVEKLEKENLDIILLDIVISGIYFFRVCEIRKPSDYIKNIQIIMLTSMFDFNSRYRGGFEMGVSDY